MEFLVLVYTLVPFFENLKQAHLIVLDVEVVHVSSTRGYVQSPPISPIYFGYEILVYLESMALLGSTWGHKMLHEVKRGQTKSNENGHKDFEVTCHMLLVK